MPRNHPVYVYPKDCTDFTTTGLVGDLMPIEGTFTEEKNGVSEVVIKMPYDQYEKWKAARIGTIIKCEVPVRVPPVIENDEYSGTVKMVKTN